MSVQELKKNQKYRIFIYLGEKNNPYTEIFYGGKKEACLKESELKLQFKSNNCELKKNMMFKTLSEEYLDIQKDRLSITTYRTYQDRLCFINTKIGNYKLKDISPIILDRFYSYLKNEYVSSKKNIKINNTTIQHYYSLINNVFEQAIKWGYIKDNPNKRVEKPKRERKEIDVYTKEEVIQLLECLKNESLLYQITIVLALDTGCRLSELIALTWEDIDFNTKEVRINKSVQTINGKNIEKETKSLNSDRRIYITDSTLSLLKQYQIEQKKKQLILGKAWGNSKRILTNDLGKALHHDTPYNILQKVLEKYGLRKITFHALRHTNASLKIGVGIQHQIISRSLGHSSVQVTDMYYSHFYKEEFEDMSNKMNDSLFSKVM